ncbi:MAG TPA: hypothetical protein VKN99_20355 [Polyangia bacterium]|nr:hypothetical protein [Polyangia bacterium]
MRLKPWRGRNVLITDSLGCPVLKLDRLGNLLESHGGPPGRDDAPANVRSLERLAAKVAIWIEWTAVEPGEFRARDIHPDIRERVALIADQFVARDDADGDELDREPPPEPVGLADLDPAGRA